MRAYDMLTVREVADRLGYDRVEAVLRLINSGALRAIDTSASPGRRTLRVDPADLAAFLESRRVVPTSPAKRRRRKPWPAAETPDFFPDAGPRKKLCASR
jgi:hypothetical protein